MAMHPTATRGIGIAPASLLPPTHCLHTPDRSAPIALRKAPTAALWQCKAPQTGAGGQTERVPVISPVCDAARQ
eukprot:CAMPEP_0206246146 /NCGR_PEP_ID=MMETSP0047_2-20121206/19089_1 /ASSEMBLY_ACC=CAM_ASM_000192 /TAXON_ID=195065 /ORGANISM="Chroomonas mesostigmatica_cf, Strain CCMP1168" /LENGTH=73 /DNA_ID=CAMNT_0053671521 /DNA_START=245 /DNA_END=463 /DNA_ORIENTATION=-